MFSAPRVLLITLATSHALEQPKCDCSLFNRVACAAPSAGGEACKSQCCAPSQRCPAGGYMKQDVAASGLDSYQFQRDRAAAGWMPTLWQRSGDNYERTGVATWCSAVTAKPPECRADPLATLGHGDRIFHHDLPSGRPGFPVRSVHGGRVEMLHNYKVAGTALKRYMTCEYGEEGDSDFAVSVLAVRDPIDRFVSAVGEVLQRFLNNVCPDGPCTDALRRAGASRNTAWHRVADAAHFNLTADVLPALVSAFVDDISCCHSGYALDHLQPQVFCPPSPSHLTLPASPSFPLALSSSLVLNPVNPFIPFTPSSTAVSHPPLSTHHTPFPSPP